VTLLWQGVGLGDPQRSLPTPTILWFCDKSGRFCWRPLGSSELGPVSAFQQRALPRRPLPNVFSDLTQSKGHLMVIGINRDRLATVQLGFLTGRLAWSCSWARLYFNFRIKWHSL